MIKPGYHEGGICDLGRHCINIVTADILKLVSTYPGIQFRLPCTPGTIFHGCQIVLWDPLDAKRRCPKKGLGYMKMHGFHGNTYALYYG